MRKGRKRDRYSNQPGEDAETAEDENTIEDVPDSRENTRVEDAGDRMTDPSIDVSADLDSLSRDIEQSIKGATSAAPSSAEPSSVPPPPARNATPEDILGLQTQAFTELEDSTPSVAPAKPSEARTETSESIASKPTKALGEHAAMANEVLRATSDEPRGSRKRKRHQVEAGDSPGDAADREDADEEQNENVRFSEDVTISANRRSRRKLFGR